MNQLFPHPDLGYTGKHERLDEYQAAPTHTPFTNLTGSTGIADKSFKGKITFMPPGQHLEALKSRPDGAKLG